MGLDEIQAEYRDKLYQSMADFLSSERPITAFRNEHRRAVNDGFTMAFIAGWADGGAEGLIGDDEQAWLNDRIESEIGFDDDLFQQLKALRADPDLTLDDKLAAIESRADGYTATLPGIYAQGQLMAAPHIELVFDGEDGSADSVCQKTGGTCVKLKGQSHPAQWWLDNDLVPRRGNDNFDCGGWNCRHRLVDKNGKVWAQAND
jgi:hypothetical protein